MLKIIALGVALGGGLVAQGDGCPDQVIQKVQPIVTAQFPQTCGANLNTTIGGVSITSPVNICPLVVIIRPGHATTVEDEGSGTYTEPAGTTPILSLTFRCQETWLLGVIPIVVSSHCAEGSRSVVGVVTHYEQLTCRAGNGDDETDDGEREIGGTDSGDRIHTP